MSKKPKHVPTASDLIMADNVDDLMSSFMAGELSGLGVCATTRGGTNLYFFLDHDRDGSLAGSISKLMGLHAVNQRFRKQINAPQNNRSWRSH